MGMTTSNPNANPDPEGGELDARLKICVVRPKSTLEFVIPIGPILVDDFLQNILENLIC